MPRPRRPAVPTCLIAFALLLASCGTGKPPPEVMTRDRFIPPPAIPEAAKTCRPSPATPSDDAGDAAYATWIADLWAWGDDCQHRLADLVKIVSP